MSALHVLARFPLGQFNAHDAHGEPEWPPAPARVLGAMLASAYATGLPVEPVRRLYSLPPPLIRTPVAGVRDSSWGKWVSVNPAVKNVARGSLERTGNLLKHPEKGMLLDAEAEVRWTFDSSGQALDLPALQAAARAVTYLGRPTSPVMLSVSAGPSEEVNSRAVVEWTPDERGEHMVNIATPVLLEDLDTREEQRRSSPSMGHHPILAHRPTARYRRSGTRDAHAAHSSERRMLLSAERATYYRFPPGKAAQSPSVATIPMAIDQLETLLSRVDELDGGMVGMVPIVDRVGAAGLPVLRGLVTMGYAPRPEITLAVPSGIIQWKPADLLRSRSVLRIVRALHSVSSEWTTLVPVARDESLGAEVQELRAPDGSAPESATSHEDSGVSTGCFAPAEQLTTHVSLSFPAPVQGPISLRGNLLVPRGMDVELSAGLPQGARRARPFDSSR